MATTGSPTKRTTPSASHGRVIIGGGNSGTIACRFGRSAKSAATYTPSTPGNAAASVVSMLTIVADATVDRT
ncbi:unannotated protein [freshwater metagenome]|uniref:Unannotated protein n=1 Tax=freshwater metagenome TaxID=449393 RepID=A0A6J7N6X9_9ZZZZ